MYFAWDLVLAVFHAAMIAQTRNGNATAGRSALDGPVVMSVPMQLLSAETNMLPACTDSDLPLDNPFAARSASFPSRFSSGRKCPWRQGGYEQTRLR